MWTNRQIEVASAMIKNGYKYSGIAKIVGKSRKAIWQMNATRFKIKRSYHGNSQLIDFSKKDVLSYILGYIEIKKKFINAINPVIRNEFIN